MLQTTVLLQKFDKLLIANRGEIAMRILRAATSWASATVAVYSDADRNAPARALRRRGVPHRPAAGPRQLPAHGQALEVAKRSGAEAIHPGYGFLAERAEFSQACV
jgi:acetyl/propionyl-CoA carboxylase alpha subunit